MNLSEEGTKTDLALVKQRLATETSFPAEHEELTKWVARREAGERVAITFCRDIASATPNLGFCESIEARRAQAGLEALVTRVRAGLPPVAAGAFDRVIATYRAFEEAEGKRTYVEWEQGTIRGLASLGAREYVRKRHAKRLEALARGPLEPADEAAAAEADRALNEAYGKLRARLETACGSGEAKVAPSAEERGHVTRCLASLKEAQLAWIRHRDAWAELAARLAAGDRAFGSSAAVLTWLSKGRTEEFAYRAAGPDEAP
jgi:uncharacterized protein YecT (DUF1311 family)